MSILNTIQRVAATSCLAGLAACTTLNVKTDSNPTLSPSMCHSYAFAHEHVANGDQPGAYGNPLNADRLRMAIESNLASKGLQRADAASADCVVGYAMGSRQVFNDYYAGFGAGWGYGAWGGWGRPGLYGGWGWDGPSVQDETRIAVDLFDAKSHAAIWHASVSQSVAEISGPNAVARINAAAAAIFAKYPGTTPAVSRPTT